MNLPVVLTREAEADFDADADWYQEQAGLGAKFTTEVREALSRIGARPEAYAILHRDIRRVRLRRFTYGLYFRVRADRVEVIAILHARRDPSVWKSRG